MKSEPRGDTAARVMLTLLTSLCSTPSKCKDRKSCLWLWTLPFALGLNPCHRKDKYIVSTGYGTLLLGLLQCTERVGEQGFCGVLQRDKTILGIV